MLRSRDKRPQSTIPCVPGTTYLSVLLTNRTLQDSYRYLQQVVDEGLQLEEERARQTPKSGYGSRFNPSRNTRTLSSPGTIGTRSPSVNESAKPRLGRIKYHKRSSSPRRTTLSLIDTDKFESTPRPVSTNQQTIDRLVIDGTLDEIYAQRKRLLTPCEPLWFPRSASNSSDDMLSVPELPGGGLKRETTSFGVYSNLAAHSRRDTGKGDEPRRVEPIQLATAGPQLKLVQAIQKSDVHQILEIFKENPDLKLQFVDESDKTVLHHCVDVQKRTVNSEILQILLEKNASMIDYCRNEAPVLHTAAKLGQALSVYLLLKHRADINLQYKRTFRTALHEAVMHGHKTVVEILLYNGAHTTIREKDGRFASGLCKDDVFSREAFDDIEQCIENKRIDIKLISLGSSTVVFDSIGITAQFTTEVADDIPILVKHQTIEQSGSRFPLAADEDIASDVFTYRLLQTFDGISATFSIPLFDKSFSSREEIVIRGESGDVILPRDTQSGKDGLVVVFDVNMRESDSYVCVCRPKIERWQVSKGQTVLGSVIDEQVRIQIAKNSFNSKGTLSLQVIELPENIEIMEGRILASTPFYRIDVDQKATDLTIELPRPGVFDGECRILAQFGTKWRVIDIQNDQKHDTITFRENNFPLIATVAVLKPNSQSDVVIQEVNETLNLVSNVQYRVSFLFFAKRVPKMRKFTVLVECCEVKVIEARRRFWKGQGYQEQPQKDLATQIGVQSKQAFKVVFYESAILRKNPKFVDLEFHRKRDNVVQFTVELKGKSIQCLNGRLFVYAAQHGVGEREEIIAKEPLLSTEINLVLNLIEIGQSSSSSDGLNSAKSNSTLSVKSSNSSSQSTERPASRTRGFDKRPVRPGSRNGRDAQPKRQELESQADSLKKVQESLARAMRNIDPVEEVEEGGEQDAEEKEQVEDKQTEVGIKEDESLNFSNPDFLDDTLLEMVIDELGDDWYKIFVLAGMSFVDVEEMLLQSKNMILVKRQLLRKWRDENVNREDLGLPLLLAALFKGGCRNIATTVQIRLKRWYEKWKSSDNEFQKWVAKAYQDSDLFVPSDYPKPMSDQYLVLMSDELPPSQDLARALQIADTVSNAVLENSNYILDGIKVMKLLTLFRDRTERGIDALEKAIAVLGELDFQTLRKYAIMCAKAWVKRTATRKDDPFRYQVDSLMNKLQ